MTETARKTNKNTNHKGRKDGNAFSILTNVMGIILIVLVVLVLVPVFLPKILGYQTFNVISGSMEPSLPVGSLVLTKGIPAEEVQVGDVIVFHRGGTAVTHRVVENQVEEQQFITKGDANKAEDFQPVPYQDLVGVVRHHYATLGALMGFFTTLTGKIILIALIAIGALMQVLAGKLRE